MDIERMMEFILEQNAATAAALQRMAERSDRLEENLAVHTEWKVELSQALQDLATRMRDAFVEMARRHNQLVEHVDQLAQAQKDTKGELNILMRTVQDILPRLPKH